MDTLQKNGDSLDRLVETMTDRMDRFKEKCDQRKDKRQGNTQGGFGRKRRRE